MRLLTTSSLSYGPASKRSHHRFPPDGAPSGNQPSGLREAFVDHELKIYVEPPTVAAPGCCYSLSQDLNQAVLGVQGRTAG